MSRLKKTSNSPSPRGKFRLDKHDAKLAGVCGGIANYTNIDPVMVRVGFVIGGFVSLGTAAILYAAIALIAD